MGQDEAANACLLKAKLYLTWINLILLVIFNKNVDQLGVNGSCLL